MQRAALVWKGRGTCSDPHCILVVIDWWLMDRIPNTVDLCPLKVCFDEIFDVSNGDILVMLPW